MFQKPPCWHWNLTGHNGACGSVPRGMLLSNGGKSFPRFLVHKGKGSANWPPNSVLSKLKYFKFNELWPHVELKGARQCGRLIAIRKTYRLKSVSPYLSH